MRNRVVMWIFVRVVRAAVAVEQVCQGIQAAYVVMRMLGQAPELYPAPAPRLRLVRGGRQ